MFSLRVGKMTDAAMSVDVETEGSKLTIFLKFCFIYIPQSYSKIHYKLSHSIPMFLFD